MIDDYLKTGKIEDLLDDSPRDQMDDQQKQPNDIDELRESKEEIKNDIENLFGSIENKSHYDLAPIPVTSNSRKPFLDLEEDIKIQGIAKRDLKNKGPRRNQIGKESEMSLEQQDQSHPEILPMPRIRKPKILVKQT